MGPALAAVVMWRAPLDTCLTHVRGAAYRLSEGLARMRLKATVEKEDVEEAIRLMNVATQTAATDPRTGAIDMDMIATGRTAVRCAARCCGSIVVALRVNFPWHRHLLPLWTRSSH